MAQLTVPIEIDRDELQKMVDQAKNDLAAEYMTKDQVLSMLIDIAVEVIEMENPYGTDRDLIFEKIAFLAAENMFLKIINQRVGDLQKEIREAEISRAERIDDE